MQAVPLFHGGVSMDEWTRGRCSKLNADPSGCLAGVVLDAVSPRLGSRGVEACVGVNRGLGRGNNRGGDIYIITGGSV